MIQQLVHEFHMRFGAPIGCDLGNRRLNYLRYSLIREELDELDTALVSEDLVAVADALGDLAYVVYGAAVSYGINLDAVIREIHRSNMTKLMPDGTVTRREDGKVLKGPNFEEPQIAALLGV